MGFIVRCLVTAVGVAAAVYFVPGISTVGSDSTIAIAALAIVLSLINVSIKPILQVLSMPITVLTLGIFYLIVNALLLQLAASLSTSFFGSGIAIESFFSAILGSVVISVVSSIVNGIIGND